VSAEAEQRYRAVMSRFSHASRLLDAIELLGPENFALWLEHLTALFDSVDSRLGLIEKRLDDADIPAIGDGIPDEDVPQYLALYVINPLADHMDAHPVLRQRLAAYRGPEDSQPAGEETSS
jgi:hypothetical protein